MAKPNLEHGVIHFGAVWLSLLFHPFVISVLVLFLVQLLSGYPVVVALGWTALSFAIVILPLLTFLLIRVRAGRYQDMDVSIREDRHLLYGFSGISFILLIALLALLQAPLIVQRSLQAALLAVALGAVINRLATKLSLHALAMAGSSSILFSVSPLAGLILGVISLLVGWSRIYLRRHTLLEVVLGWLVGILAVATWLVISAHLYAIS